MNFFIKKCLKTVSAVLIILCLVSFFSFAEGKNRQGVKDGSSQLICAYSPAKATADEIASAGVKGADMICVTLDATSYDSTGRQLEPTLDSGILLSDAFEALGEGTSLLIKAQGSQKSALYGFLKENGLLGRAVLMLNIQNKELFSWLDTLEEKPLVFSSYKGVVIFNCTSAIKASAQHGAAGIVLKSSNAYSTTFMRSEVKKCVGLRAVIDMTDYKACGKRTDTEAFWDDVAGRGFSVIITSDLDGFLLYRQRSLHARARLASLTQKLSDTDLKATSKITAKNFNYALGQAKQSLSSDCGATLLDERYNSLLTAYENVKSPDGTKGSLTVSKGRVIAAVLVLAGFVAVEYGFEYFKKKKEKERSAQKSKAN